MDRVLSRGMRLAFGAAVLAMTGFGVSSAVAEPAPVREAAMACRPGYYTCGCEEFTYCSLRPCPICP